MKNQITKLYRFIGPGFMVAAAGIGAGDMVVGIKAGSVHGVSLLWAVIFTAIIKYFLTEGIARWQIATGTSIIYAWTERIAKPFSLAMFVLLIIWSFMVAGALISASGIAGHALFPGLSIQFWGIFHSFMALLLVLTGNYNRIENITKVLIMLMFLVVIVSAIIVKPNLGSLSSSLMPNFNLNSFTLIFAILGGVGGSVTMVSYGYWLKEKKWESAAYFEESKAELKASYIFTALFVTALMIIASSIGDDGKSGTQLILSIADRLNSIAGNWAKYIFLIGFWGVVFSSVLCVWQGIPYLFADFLNHLMKKENPADISITDSIYYKGFLVFMAVPPVVLVFLNNAVSNIINYALISTIFILFLAITLLIINNKVGWVNEFKNGWFANLILGSSIVVFLFILLNQMKLF